MRHYRAQWGHRRPGRQRRVSSAEAQHSPEHRTVKVENDVRSSSAVPRRMVRQPEECATESRMSLTRTEMDAVPSAIVNEHDAAFFGSFAIDLDVGRRVSNPARALHDELVRALAVPIDNCESRPCGGNTRTHLECIPSLVQADDCFQTNAIHPACRP